MNRHANQRNPTRLAIVLVFEPHEMRMWKQNGGGPSDQLGGYGRFENHLIEITNPETGICALGPEDFLRAVVYCQKTDSGGPNRRIRATCIPALRRAGIDVVPQWRASTNKGTNDEIQPSA